MRNESSIVSSGQPCKRIAIINYVSKQFYSHQNLRAVIYDRKIVH